MKKFVVAAVLAAGVAVLASAALGSTKSPARTSSAGSALVSCGTTRTIGIAAPITGPASLIGQQLLRWTKYYVKRWNAQKAKA
jgi:ABC-type branched-subunit amino acid transport system substrate-binding protein